MVVLEPEASVAIAPSIGEVTWTDCCARLVHGCSLPVSTDNCTLFASHYVLLFTHTVRVADFLMQNRVCEGNNSQRNHHDAANFSKKNQALSFCSKPFSERASEHAPGPVAEEAKEDKDETHQY